MSGNQYQPPIVVTNTGNVAATNLIASRSPATALGRTAQPSRLVVDRVIFTTRGGDATLIFSRNATNDGARELCRFEVEQVSGPLDVCDLARLITNDPTGTETDGHNAAIQYEVANTAGATTWSLIAYPVYS